MGNSIFRTLVHKPVVCCAVAVTMLFCEPCAAALVSSGPGVVVAFVGIRYENVDPVVQTRIRVGILGALYQNETLKVITPDQVEQTIGGDRLRQFFANDTPDSLEALCSTLGAEYIFAGSLKGLKEDTTHTILEGSLYRYDRAKKILQNVKVLRYADEFDREIARLKADYIETIVPPSSDFFSKYWPVVAVGAIVVGGIIVVIASGASSSSPGGQSTPPPTSK